MALLLGSYRNAGTGQSVAGCVADDIPKRSRKASYFSSVYHLLFLINCVCLIEAVLFLLSDQEYKV
jgi:hypothetical protein